jgi:protein-L-isoaspartate(D-aspartate) O-methyltransferase
MRQGSDEWHNATVIVAFSWEPCCGLLLFRAGAACQDTSVEDIHVQHMKWDRAPLMTQYSRARMHMIDSQLRSGGVTDKRILARMSVIERERFLPPARQPTAYTDSVQWLGKSGAGRFIAPPATFAKLLQLAEITEADHVLDVGAASGYSTVVIAGLAASVHGYEADAELAAIASRNIGDLGLDNAEIVQGIGADRYDVLFIEGTLQTIPPDYLAALKEGGRLVALLRSGGVAVATVLVRTGAGFASSSEFNAYLPPLFAAQPSQEFVF